MRGKRPYRTPMWVCALLVVIASPPSPRLWWTSLAYASPQDATHNVAKLPSAEAGGPTTQAQPAEKAAARSEAAKTQVAQLPGEPALLSAAALIRQAYDYMFYGDFANERACLEQAVAAEQGTPDAARAMALLASMCAESDPARAETLFSQAAKEYASPEAAAFAELVEAYGAAARSQNWPQVEAALSAAGAAWRGTPTGAWAALRLGDHYRWDVEDWDKAIATFQAVLAEYGAGPVAEEAAVSLAETVNWSGKAELGQVIELYRNALSMTSDPAFRRRALAGLGDCCEAIHYWAACWDTLSQIVDNYPTHPAAAHAAIIRGHAAQELGYWEAAVGDASFYLASTNQQPFWRTYANYVLAQDAFRAGAYDQAEAQFAAVCELAEEPRAAEFRGLASAGIAACREARGDRRGALAGYLEAADHAWQPRHEAVYLYQAAGLAQSLGDSATFQQIADRMVSELPGSHLTTRLVGHEVLPAPDI